MGLISRLIGGNDGTKRDGRGGTHQSPAESGTHNGNGSVEKKPSSERGREKRQDSSSRDDTIPRWAGKLLRELENALNTLLGHVKKQRGQIEEDHRELKDRLSRLESSYSHMGQLVAGLAERQQASRTCREDRAERRQAQRGIRAIRDRLETLEDHLQDRNTDSGDQSQQFHKPIMRLLKEVKKQVGAIRPQDQLMLELCNEVGQLDRGISHLRQKLEEYPSSCGAGQDLEEAVSLFQGIRASLVGLLRSRGARLVDSLQGEVDLSIHQPCPDRRRRPDQAKGDGEVVRPGLVVEENGGRRVLRPARVALYEDVDL